MFVYKESKLYILEGDKVVGVDVTPTSITKVEGVEEDFDYSFELIEPFEMKCKFNVTELTPYVFPVERPEVQVEPDKVEVVKEEVVTKEVKKESAKRR